MPPWTPWPAPEYRRPGARVIWPPPTRPPPSAFRSSGPPDPRAAQTASSASRLRQLSHVGNGGRHPAPRRDWPTALEVLDQLDRLGGHAPRAFGGGAPLDQDGLAGDPAGQWRA